MKSELFADTVDDIYQKSLSDVPEENFPITDFLNDEFVSGFITAFNGSKLNGDSLTPEMVKSLFSEIEEDRNAVNSDAMHTGISDISDDMSILQNFIDGKRRFDSMVNTAYHDVCNSGNGKDCAEMIAKVRDRMAKPALISGDTQNVNLSDYESVGKYYSGIGLLSGNDGTAFNMQYAMNHPEVSEEFLALISSIVSKTYTVADLDALRWAAKISKPYWTARKSGKYQDSQSKEIADKLGDLYMATTVSYRAIMSNSEKSDGKISDSDGYLYIVKPLIITGKMTYSDDGNMIISEKSVDSSDISSMMDKIESAVFSFSGYTDETHVLSYPSGAVENASSLEKYIHLVNKVKSAGSDGYRLINIVKLYILAMAFATEFDGRSAVPSIESEKKIEAYIGDMCTKFSEFNISKNDIFNIYILFTSSIPRLPFEKYVARKKDLYNGIYEFVDQCRENEITDTSMEEKADTMNVINAINGKFSTVQINLKTSKITVSHEITDSDVFSICDFLGESLTSSIKNENRFMNYIVGSVFKDFSQKISTGISKPISDAVVTSAFCREEFNRLMSIGKKMNYIISPQQGIYSLDVSKSKDKSFADYSEELRKYVRNCSYDAFVKEFGKSPENGFSLRYVSMMNKIIGKNAENA